MSCGNNIKEFNHPVYGTLDPSQARELRDEWTRSLIDAIGGLSKDLSKREVINIEEDTVTKYYYTKVCTIIKSLGEIDPEWSLNYCPLDGERLKIKLHDCRCHYHACQG
jgi:hypothetical protein